MTEHIFDQTTLRRLLDLHTKCFYDKKGTKKDHSEYERLKSIINDAGLDYEQTKEHNLVLRGRVPDRVQEIHRLSDVIKGLSISKAECVVCGKKAVAVCSQSCIEQLPRLSMTDSLKQLGGIFND